MPEHVKRTFSLKNVASLLITNSAEARGTTDASAEIKRVRRWSTSSDLLAVETMHDLTSAPRMLVGGRTVFLNPDTNLKRIKQLPSLRVQRRGRISAEADMLVDPRDAFPRHISRVKSLQLYSAAIQAVSRMSSLSASSSLKSRVSSTSSSESDLEPTTSSPPADDVFETTPDRRFPRARSFSVPNASSLQMSLTRQKSVRTFAPSSRFGDPASWKRGASWAELIEQAEISKPKKAGVQAAGGVVGPATQSQEVDVGPRAGHCLWRVAKRCSDEGPAEVFRPVRPTW